MNFFKEKVCNVCGHNNFTYYSYGNHKNKLSIKFFKLLVLRYLHFILHLLRKENINVEKRLLFCELYKISRCNNCGYGIYERDISTDMLKKYYKNIYWFAAGSDNPLLKYLNNDQPFLNDPRANGQYKMVKDYLPRSESIKMLEVGPGEALFSRLFSYYHPKASIEVVEPGIGWEEYYKDVNIHKVSDYFPFSTSKQYDYIHSSHQLEHVIPDIEKITNALNKFLILGGLLFIEVPNCNSEYWELETGDIPHIHFFTEKSIVLLIEQAGFKCLNIGVYGATVREILQYFHPNTKKEDPPKELVAEDEKSIKESIPRKDGACLRALFRKVN